MGASLGLACLTKSVAFVLAPPLVILVALIGPWQPHGKWIRELAAAGLLALALNTPHLVRNYRLFHSLLGISPAPHAAFKYTNDRFGAGPLLSNVLRNLALHASTPLDSVNRAVEAGCIRVLGAAGENPDDPDTTWDFTAFHVPPFTRHEATAGNPLHAVLILLVCGILLWRWKAIETRQALLLAIGLAAAFLLFCAVFKWQPWHTRLHLPLFALWAAVIGTVLARCWPAAPPRRWAWFCCWPLPRMYSPIDCGPSSAQAGISSPRPARLYFTDLADPRAFYEDAVKFVESSHCPEIGLDLSQAQNEIPLRPVARTGSGRPIRNVYVTNESRVYDAAADRPAACVICPHCAPDRPGWTTLKRQFRSVRYFGPLAVLSGAALSNACTAEFSGWYDVEESAEHRWRWSSGKGVIQINATQALQADLEAEFLTARHPNEVRISGERRAKPRCCAKRGWGFASGRGPVSCSRATILSSSSARILRCNCSPGSIAAAGHASAPGRRSCAPGAAGSCRTVGSDLVCGKPGRGNWRILPRTAPSLMASSDVAQE